MIEINKIYNDEALELLSKINDNFVNLILIDPPYEIDYRDLDWDKPKLAWTLLLSEFYRILKDNGNLIIFQGWSNVNLLIQRAQFDVLERYKFYLQNWIIYDRIKGRGAKYNFTSTREDILWFTKNENYIFNKISSNIKKKTGGMGLKNGNEFRSLSNVWTDISPIVPWSKEKVNHPTQKPLQLFERLVKIFSNEEDIVLDCFAGSFVTAEACKKLNRNFICSDDVEEYYDMGVKRLNLL